MKRQEHPELFLPRCVQDYIDLVVKKVRYRRKIRTEVREELTAHFLDALRECANEAEREKLGRELIEEFGDVKI